MRVICARAYHALFMHNMLIRPTAEELERVRRARLRHLQRRPVSGQSADTTADDRPNQRRPLSFERREFVILGTEYAGEMKKGVFTIMNYLMPKQGVLSMHCSANEGATAATSSLFFGLSGTGKTTLSADPRAQLIGDDEHCWSDDGVFNIEGGCYAKCIDLIRGRRAGDLRRHPLRHGAGKRRLRSKPPAWSTTIDASITENTRAAYPIEFIPNAKIPCVGGHPANIIFLTCDAFGVLPPVSRLTPEQAMYHFISGYTAKVAGTEVGVTEPEATFSACFGAAFLVWHPTNYAELLAEKIKQHGAAPGWSTPAGRAAAMASGRRVELAVTRGIIDAIHAGQLADAAVQRDPVFGLDAVTAVPGVAPELLVPSKAWSREAAWEAEARRLAGRFRENFASYAEAAGPDVVAAGPVG